MIYGTQHSGNGKYHLIDLDDTPNNHNWLKELCGYREGLYSYHNVEIENGEVYELGDDDKTRCPAEPVPPVLRKVSYCQTCLKIAFKRNREERNFKQDE